MTKRKTELPAIPNKKTMILDRDCWIIAIALGLYIGSFKPREGLQHFLRQYATQLSTHDERFRKILEHLREHYGNNAKQSKSQFTEIRDD